MQRRALLRTVSAVTAAAAAGLAGCNSGDGEKKRCGTPNAELQSALPRGNDFPNPSIDTNNNATEVGGATNHVLASYVTDNENYLFIIAEYDSNSTAAEAAAAEENWVGFGYPVTGYVVVEQYVYVAMGPSESSVIDLMAAAAPLNENCASEEITFSDATPRQVQNTAGN